jgi:hypothetical protein
MPPTTKPITMSDTPAISTPKAQFGIESTTLRHVNRTAAAHVAVREVNRKKKKIQYRSLLLESLGF